MPRVGSIGRFFRPGASLLLGIVGAAAPRRRPPSGAPTSVSSILVIRVDERVGTRYGAIRGELEKAGRIIGPNDLWIAAHAQTLGIALVTNNTGEFDRVGGLTLEDWTTP